MEGEEIRNQSQAPVSGDEEREVGVKDRGLFGFMAAEKKQQQEEVLVTGMENVHVTEVAKVEEAQEEKEEGLFHKLHRSHSSSSSSSSDEEEEEVLEGGEKKRKKKVLKEKIKEKLHGEKQEETTAVAVEEAAVSAYGDDSTVIAVEKVDETVKLESAVATEDEGEKKGFLEKIKEKLPGGGQKKQPGEEAPATAGEYCTETADSGQEGKLEKKGLLGKIMEKLPGYNKGGGEEKEGDKAGCAGH